MMRFTPGQAILRPAMRRILLLTAVLLVALPVAAAWPSGLAPGDGTLVVDNGRGVVTVHARGGIIGRFDSGNLVVENLDQSSTRAPIVFGADRIQDLGNGKIRYSGDDIRFRMIGSLFHVRINAIGIDVSAVGRGNVQLDASGFTDFPGRFSINGGTFQPLPGHLTNYTLGQAPPGQLGK
jgi:hypothetical protein